ncbi:MAG: hypothetical protein ACR2NU_13840 [Aeoliella sp.]
MNPTFPMNQRQTTNAVAALDKLLTLLSRSFPQYLQHSRPYVPAGRDDVQLVFDDIVEDQTLLAERAIDQLSVLGAVPTGGEFPMEFTDTHDLSIDFLVEQAIQYHQQDIQTLRELSQALKLAPSAKAIVDEALGMAQGHLESLQEC